MSMEMPSWEECEKYVKEGVANPLHRLIYDTMPGDSVLACKFRKQLADALEFVAASALTRKDQREHSD